MYQSCKYNMKLILMERGMWDFTQERQEVPPRPTDTVALKNALKMCR